MRIDRLKIPSYRNLREFEIDFDETQPTTVLLGRNGTGKSNLIEAVVEIFRDLESASSPLFQYSLAYVCRGKRIEIDADPGRTTKRLNIRIDGRAVTQAAFQERLHAYLPSYVFAYYSGWSSRLERHFDRPTRIHYDRVLNNPDGELPLRRMFFCRKEYSQLVLLAFFLSESPAANDVLRRYLNIEKFESALFVLKRPWWRGSGEARPIQVAEGDSRFWYARGAFKGFLNRLWRAALAPIRNEESVERDIRRQPESTERLYLFVKDEKELTRLKQEGEDTKIVFGYLEGLFLCDLIDEVRVTVRRTDGRRVKFTQMSEGEQQLLTVLGLLLFTQDDESLYLLDEPDTHLNPVWTYDYLKLLQENMRAEKGQLIVATHNPLMVGSLHRNQVRLLALDDKSISAAEPDCDPSGIGIEGLLQSELYGLRSTLSADVIALLDERAMLLAKEERDDDEDVKLRGLSDQLAALGVALTHPNPYFDEFSKALSRNPLFRKPVLTPAESEQLAQDTDELLKEILAEEKRP